jgi:hypothetical protein
MSARILSRIIAVIVLGLVMSVAMDQFLSRYHQGGKDAYIAAESKRFDRFYTHPGHFPIMSCIFVTAIFAGGYELVVFAAYKAIRSLGFSDTLTRRI